MTDIAGNAPKSLQKSWGWFFALGILLMIGGLTALYTPFAASLVVEMIVGASFLAGGIISLVQIFTTKDGWGARTVYLLLGIFNVVAGALLFFRPLEGLFTLTLLMIVAMLVNGVIRGAVGLQSRPTKGWGWLTTSGAVSVVIAIYFFTQYPGISAVLLGIFAGVSLIGEGAGYLRFAYSAKTGEDISLY